jgi:nitrate reductase NapE component
MGIQRICHENTNVFGFEVIGKLTPHDVEAFFPEMENAIKETNGKFRLLIDVTKMEGANVKSEWEIFEFLKKHISAIQLIGIVGAHSWTKVMSEIITESVFVDAPTLYFKPEEIEQAWMFLMKAPPPKYVEPRRYLDSDKGLFTKHGSPNYI